MEFRRAGQLREGGFRQSRCRGRTMRRFRESLDAAGSSLMTTRCAAVKRETAMNRIPMTEAGFQKLEAEMKRLKTVDRPAVIQAIAEAREHGDLSENAEYHAAREQQGWIERRIKELGHIVGNAQVIDVSKLDGPVKFGATVTVRDESTGRESTYQIVSEAEADPKSGLLNLKAPLAAALIGCSEGDLIEVNTPRGEKNYSVLKVAYR